MSIRRALIVSTAERYIGMLVSLLSLPIIARLMTAEEFGVAVIGQAISAIAIAMRDFASQTYLINREDAEEDSVRTLFTLMMLSSAVICGAIMLMSGWLEVLYAREDLAVFLLLNCLGLMLEPFHLTIGGLLRRELAFGRVTAINVTIAVVQASTLVGLAWLGFGFLAFGWSWVAAAAIGGVVAIAIRPHLGIFRPGLRHARDAIRFGGYNSAASVLYRLYDSVPLLVLGHVLNVNALGNYFRAVSIAQLPERILLGGLISVTLPAFARNARSGHDLRPSYLRAIELITAVYWPALLIAAILAEPIVRVLLGAQWMEVAPLLRIVAVAWMVTFYSELNYPILVTTGGIRRNLLRALIVYPISSATIITAAFFGVTAVAWSLFFVLPFQAAVSFFFVCRALQLPFHHILVVLPRSAAATLCAAAGPLAMHLLHDGTTRFALWQVVWAVGLAAPGWLIGLRLVRHPMWAEIVKMVGYARQFLARRRSGHSSGNLAVQGTRALGPAPERP
jgi:O-antigen/teichoic acid export membrane protein